jgi:OmpA-OmpF porin, OOP family
MRFLWGLAAAGTCATAGLARADIPDDRAIDVQTFEYAIGPKTFFTVGDADVAAKRQLAIDALVTYLTKPFKVYNVDPGNMVGSERTTVVDSLAAAQITGAYGVTDKLQLGVNLPLIFALSGDGLDAKSGNAACAMPPCLQVTGLGDLLVEGKLRLYKHGIARVAGMAGVTLPTSFGSGGSEFIGDNLPTLRARVAVQLDPSPKVSLGMNGGVLLRKPRTIYDSTIGPQFTWGLGAALRLTDRFSIIGESYGRAGLPDFSLDSSPLEVEGGIRIYATPAVAVVVGGGAGLIRGIGAPEARFFVSLGYAPDVRDSDGDGIPNGRDKCVLVPEDKDGFQDDDGCPDDDNDGDRRPDAVDQCPNAAEDLDGFDDADGCPELDNDKDGILDLADKCPGDPEDGKEPNPKDGCPANKRDSDGDGITDDVDQCPAAEEDVDGFEDGDGCPEPDNDGDGILDAADKCPLCPEDKDGFQDDDGCPDPDNDKDGIPDGADKCPLEPETINGVADADGCPDSGGVTVVALDGDRLIVDGARDGRARRGHEVADRGRATQAGRCHGARCRDQDPARREGRRRGAPAGHRRGRPGEDRRPRPGARGRDRRAGVPGGQGRGAARRGEQARDRAASAAAGQGRRDRDRIAQRVPESTFGGASADSSSTSIGPPYTFARPTSIRQTVP